MSWKQNLSSLLADLLRLSIRVCLFVDGILLALFSVWLTFRFLYQTIGWLNRVLFSGAW